MSFKIFTDAAADMPLELATELDIAVAPMGVTIGDVTFTHDSYEREMSISEFYSRIRAGESATTAAVSPADWMKIIEPELQAGNDALILAFSSALSATSNNAKLVADELSEKYPDRKIFAVDTLCASVGEALIVRLAAIKRNEGATIEETRDFVEREKLHICHWVLVDDLSHVRRGGRISATSAVVGTMLGIKPIIHMNDNGELVTVGKVRGRKNAINELIRHMETTGVDLKGQTVMIGDADCREETIEMAKLIKEKFGVKDVILGWIGIVIGAHIGPGTIALFYTGTTRN